ncbi:MAG: exo-beta-N-acetylmuramidase NamZ domain-containing protein [Cytophagaceae bacterium]
MNKLFFFTLTFVLTGLLPAASCQSSNKKNHPPVSDNVSESEFKQNILTGAEQFETYLPLLKNKRIGLAVNHTSMVKDTHLADTLLSLGIQVKRIFSPEHGFRGKADAGEKVNHEKDPKTGLPIISLYGNNKKPTADQLKDLDVIVFDIQDVGVRFYTYISTMHYIMEACAESGKQVIVLDRPNPNGHYIDGPVLKPAHKSFVGIHPIPIVHGLTVGELAKMINGEGWLDKGVKCDLVVIPCKNYTHNTRYSLPTKPSPNLPNDLSIQLYPSLCLFEGTPVSVGRGTDMPFQVFGMPEKDFGAFSFTPKSTDGAKNPPYENQLCFGKNLNAEKVKEGFTLDYLIYSYQKTSDKDKFFTNFFESLAGTETLRKQIKEGWTQEKIRESWKEDLLRYKSIRKKYLLYPDFE